MPPRAYNPDAQPDKLLLARSKACEFWGKHKEAHESIRRVSGLATFFEFWQIHHSAVDPAPEYRGVTELLVRWGLDVADEKALWTVVICSEDAKEFYEKIGFEHLKTHVASVPGDDEVLELAWLRRRPQPR
jgi:N-acetylglutamate synthase-like GNAT family acetyltransferase